MVFMLLIFIASYKPYNRHNPLVNKPYGPRFNNPSKIFILVLINLTVL